MSDAVGPKLDPPEGSSIQDDAEVSGWPQKLTVMSPPVYREARPVTNLGKVFGQFAELQQQIAEQVVALEDSVHHQREEIASAVAQLPELRERINWLIASFDEQSKKDESVHDRLNRHDAALATLFDLTKSVQETQGRYHTAIDEVVTSLLRAKAVLGAPPTPTA